jgi:hypothetical protein
MLGFGLRLWQSAWSFFVSLFRIEVHSFPSLLIDRQLSFVVLSLLLSTDPTSAEDTANESSDLTDRDTEDEEVLEEEGVTGEEEEEGTEDAGNKEENEEDEPVSTMT